MRHLGIPVSGQLRPCKEAPLEKGPSSCVTSIDRLSSVLFSDGSFHQLRTAVFELGHHLGLVFLQLHKTDLIAFFECADALFYLELYQLIGEIGDASDELFLFLVVDEQPLAVDL